MAKQIKNRKLIFILAALLIVAVVLFSLEKFHVTNFTHKNAGSSTQNSGPTPEQKAAETKANSEAKKNFIEDTSQNNASNTTTPPQSSSIDLSARQEANNTVTVFTRLYSISSGKCTLVVTNNGPSQTYAADIIYQSEYSTCEGFSIPIKSAGNWTLQLNVNSGGKVYTKSLNYQVK